MNIAAFFVNVSMKDSPRVFSMGSGWWRNLITAGEALEILWSLPVHNIERREDFWIEQLSTFYPYGLTNDFGE